jgi:serine/threonine-protein kinase
VLGGRYELKRKLGSGGMATVYEAHDGLLDRAVAVKLLRSDALSEGVARQRFAAEARAAASLTHPYAVAVYDVSSADEQPFIVMELVRGRTLEDVLADNGELGEAQAVSVGSQVLAALHAAHLRGLVHRDVKPANILLPDGVVPSSPDRLPGAKLADFGIAKAIEDTAAGLTRVGQVIGTPRYLSPEQVSGQRATPKSDLYATAVVLYEMLAGRAPFERDSALGLAMAHRDDEPPPLVDHRSDVNPGLAAVVHRALSKDPAQRPADAQEMREALIAAASGVAPDTALLGAGAAGTEVLRRTDAGNAAGTTEAIVPTTAPTRAPEWTAPGTDARRRRGWLLAAVAVLIVAGVASAVWLATRAGAPDPAVPAGDQRTAEPSEEPQQAPQQDDGPAQQQNVPPPGQDAPEPEPTEQPQDEQPAGDPDDPSDEDPPDEDPTDQGPEPPPVEDEDPPPDEDPPDLQNDLQPAE